MARVRTLVVNFNVCGNMGLGSRRRDLPRDQGELTVASVRFLSRGINRRWPSMSALARNMISSTRSYTVKAFLPTLYGVATAALRVCPALSFGPILAESTCRFKCIRNSQVHPVITRLERAQHQRLCLPHLTFRSNNV